MAGVGQWGAQNRGSLDHEHEESTSLLSRKNTANRSTRNKKVSDLQNAVIESRRSSMESLQGHDQSHHLHPGFGDQRSRTPSFRRRKSPIMMYKGGSSRRGHPQHHDIGFSDTVSNVVDIVKHDRRGKPKGTWSTSTSPARSPSPSRVRYYSNRSRAYGTTSLEQRSRSPSPSGDRGPPPAVHHFHHHSHQHSYPVLVTRRGHGRRLPPTPSKPSTLQLRPASINFPKLNASPTHCPPSQVQGQYCPLSFEQAVAIGRGGRVLPSPLPNGYKPGQRPRRHSDSDEDDWC
ncbi:hypothetical protein RUM44_013373 [Polyplax serrata]|uniref:Uncharacterized protein n=1 Tax=Polyplax serrata TaxID=468196 RepID=A0ABR1BE05_POLSC